MNHLHRIIPLLGCIFGLITVSGQTTTNTWTGGGSDQDWRNPANWSEGNNFSSTVIAQFDDVNPGVVFISSSPTIAGLRYTENVAGSQIRLTNTPTGTAARSLLFWSGSNDPRVGTTIEVASNGNNVIGSGGFGTVQFVNDVEFNLSNPPGVGWTSVAAAVTNQNLGPIHMTKNGTGDLFFNNSINTRGDFVVNNGKLTLQGDSVKKFYIGDSGTNNKITGSGRVYLQGKFAFVLDNASASLGDSWLIVDAEYVNYSPVSFSVEGFNGDSGVWIKPIDESKAYVFEQFTGRLEVRNYIKSPTGSLHVAGFQHLGVPLRSSILFQMAAGPDEHGINNKLYFSFQRFLIQHDPVTGVTRQFHSPERSNSGWGFTIGKDNKVYVGGDNGILLRFDPARPEKGLYLLGSFPATTVTWRLATGKDGKIYGSTYPEARLVSFDPLTGEFTDHGRLDDEQDYARPIVAAADGWLYIGVGSDRGQIFAFNPDTGKSHGLIADELRPHIWGRNGGWHLAMLGQDGYAYGEVGDRFFRLRNGEATEIQAEEMPEPYLTSLDDGRILVTANTNGIYWLKDPDTGESVRSRFEFQGHGIHIFHVAEGPNGVIYGGTAGPPTLFEYRPAWTNPAETHSGPRLRTLGRPATASGSIYSIATIGDDMFIGVYAGAWISRFNPSREWKFGRSAEDNPFQIVSLTEQCPGHLRPRAMVEGPDRLLFVGSYPDYGNLGGSMAVLNTNNYELVQNHRHIIPNQAIISLAYCEDNRLIFGGSSIRSGGNMPLTETVAHFFAWDPDKQEKIVDLVPVSTDKHIVSVALANGLVFMCSAEDSFWYGARPGLKHLSVYDIAKQEIIHTAVIPYGDPRDVSLGLHTDGYIYGITERVIFRIHPETFEISKVAESPVEMTAGWAITNEGIYFGSGSSLWVYRWEAN